MSSGWSISVLLADDDPVSLGFANAVFQRNGCRTYSTQTATEARRLAGRHHPDLVLLDIQFPDTDGVTLLGEILKNYNLRPPPVFVALTGETRIRLHSLYLRAGFTRVLAKPATSCQLVSCLDLTDQWKNHPGKIRPNATEPGHALADDEGALEALDGDHELLIQLRQLLLQELRVSCPLLDDCLLSGDFDKARALLHKLTAGASYCGANALKKSCLSLQRLLPTAAPMKIAEGYTNFLAECDRFQFFLATSVRPA